MFGWLRKLFGRKKATRQFPYEPENRRSHGLTELTVWERDFIDTRSLCPDCAAVLLGGPQVGSSMNVLCSRCGTGFNLVFGVYCIVSARRIALPPTA